MVMLFCLAMLAIAFCPADRQRSSRPFSDPICGDNLVHDQTLGDLMTQGGVIRQLLPGPAGVKFYLIDHQAIDVAFQNNAIIDRQPLLYRQPVGMRNWYSRSWRYREAAFSSSSYFFHFKLTAIADYV